MNIQEQKNFISMVVSEKPEHSLVLTASRRQSKYYSTMISHQLAGCNTIWQTPEVYSLEDWVSDTSDRVLIEPGEKLLWQRSLESILQSSKWRQLLELSNVNDMCQLAIHAATICDLWNIDSNRSEFSYNDNSKFFSQWHRAFKQLCCQIGCSSRSQQIDHLTDNPPSNLPKRIFVTGFIELAPAYRKMLDSFTQAGCQVISYQSQPVNPAINRYSFQDTDDELNWIAEHCYDWYQETGGQTGELRMAVIVPDLDTRWQQVFSTFNHCFCGDASSGNFADANRAFNLSGGIDLLDMPIVACAWKLINLNPESLFIDLLPLLHKPALQLGISRSQQRIIDRLIGRGYRKSIYQMHIQFPDWEWLHLFVNRDYWLADDYPSRQLKKICERLEKMHWLESLSLNSSEYQQHQQWLKQINLISSLDSLEQKISMQQTINLLDSVLHTMFQPKVNESRIQILGLYEAIGLRFDRLWISGLTDQVLPITPEPTPFIPKILLQQLEGMADSNPRASLDYSTKIWHEMIAISKEISVSCGLSNGAEDNTESSFIRHLSDTEINIQPVKHVHPVEEICASEQLEPPDKDSVYTSLLLEDQSACSFRAAMRHRMAVKSKHISDYYDQLDAGILIHTILEKLPTDKQDNLIDIQDKCESLVSRTIMDRASFHPWLQHSQSSRQIQKQLVLQISDWVEKERVDRTDISVLATEKTYECTIGDLHFSFRIDRIDEAEYGGLMLVDYKTGSNAYARHWEDIRPVSPQLLAYAIAVGQQQKVSAIGFISLKLDEPGYMIYGEQHMEDTFTNKRLIKRQTWFDEKDWLEWLGKQTQAVTHLAEEFTSGIVTLTPRDNNVCKYCDYKPICRINQLRSMPCP